MPRTESAVILVVPEAHDAVAAIRARLDSSAGWGVPAHVTVLYPFVAPDHIDASVLRTLATAVGSVEAFDLTFAEVRWFDEVAVWLAPEPDGPCRALTEAVWRAFPDHPPYGGIHADVVPHLTLGHDAPIEQLREAADQVSAKLPLRARVDRAQLWQGSHTPNSWHVLAELPLGVAPSLDPWPNSSP